MNKIIDDKELVDMLKQVDEFTLHVTEVIGFCPKEFVYRNVDNKFGIFNAPRHISSKIGTYVHKAISDFLRGKQVDLKKYEKLLDGDYYIEFDRIYNNFLAWYYTYKNKLSGIKSEISTSKKISDKVTLVGTADLIASFEMHSAVFDFKTSKSTRYIKKYEEQMGGYAFMFDNIQRGYAVILGTDDFNMIEININRGRSAFVAKLEKVLDEIEYIINGGNIDTSVSFICGMCNYRGLCDGAKIIREGDGE